MLGDHVVTQEASAYSNTCGLPLVLWKGMEKGESQRKGPRQTWPKSMQARDSSNKLRVNQVR